MYQYTFDDYVTKKVKDKTKNNEHIFEMFDQIDKKFDGDCNFETETTDDKQNQTAANEENKNSTENSICNDVSEPNNQVDETQKSITTNSQNATSNNFYEELISSINEVNKKLETLSLQKQIIENQKLSALKNFDIIYAAKLHKQIDSVNFEIDQLKLKAKTFDEQLKEFNAKIDAETDNNNFIFSDAVAEVLKQNEKFSVLKKYLNNIPKDEALSELLNNCKYRESIGEENFNSIVEELNKK